MQQLKQPMTFEDLESWREARQMTRNIYTLTRNEGIELLLSASLTCPVRSRYSTPRACEATFWSAKDEASQILHGRCFGV